MHEKLLNTQTLETMFDQALIFIGCQGMLIWGKENIFFIISKYMELKYLFAAGIAVPWPAWQLARQYAVELSFLDFYAAARTQPLPLIQCYKMRTIK